MSFVIMGIDETGSEFNAGDQSFNKESSAYRALPGVESGSNCCRIKITFYRSETIPIIMMISTTMTRI